MAKTLFGVIYDTHSLAIRRVVIPDDDSQLLLHIGPGEAMATGTLMADYNFYRDGMDLAYAAVRKATGREPPSMADVHRADEASRRMGSNVTVR